jgi:hypothetical protein
MESIACERLQSNPSSEISKKNVENIATGNSKVYENELSKEDISINHAKINTLGSRAEDTFLITYKNHLKMSEKKINDLVKKLNAAIA